MNYTDEQRAELLDSINLRIVEGAYINDICKEEGMPSKATLYRWLEGDEKAKEAFRLAQQFRATVLADEINKIADDKDHDYIEIEFHDEKGVKHIEKQWSPIRLNQRRLQIDTRKWEAGKLCNIYGDKQKLEHSGPDGTPLQVASVVDAPPQETREEWEKRLKRKNGGSVDPATGASS